MGGWNGSDPNREIGFCFGSCRACGRGEAACVRDVVIRCARLGGIRPFGGPVRGPAGAGLVLGWCWAGRVAIRCARLGGDQAIWVCVASWSGRLRAGAGLVLGDGEAFLRSNFLGILTNFKEF